jgi:Icc protein
MNMELRIGILSDVHYGSDSAYQKGSKAPELLSGFLAAMDVFQPHLVVDLGDRINNIDAQRDLVHLGALVKTLGALPCALRYVLGNHDLVHLSARATEEFLGQQLMGFRIEQWQGFPLLFVNSEAQPQRSDYERLFKELGFDHDGKDRACPLIVFSHRPLLEVPLTDHKLFEAGRREHFPWGQELLSGLIDQGFSPICLNGHLHWNHLLAAGQVTQITLPSLVDRWQAGVPAGSFSTLRIRSGGIHLEVRGKLPANYDLNIEMG